MIKNGWQNDKLSEGWCWSFVTNFKFQKLFSIKNDEANFVGKIKLLNSVEKLDQRLGHHFNYTWRWGWSQWQQRWCQWHRWWWLCTPCPWRITASSEVSSITAELWDSSEVFATSFGWFSVEEVTRDQNWNIFVNNCYLVGTQCGLVAGFVLISWKETWSG